MTLKQTFTGTCAFFALASVAQAADMRPVLKAPEASQPVTGYVEVYTGWANTEVEACLGGRCGSTDFDGWALGGAGRANYWIGQGMSLQVDAQGEGTSYKVGDEHRSTTSVLVGGHLSWRNPQQSLYGVFVAGGDAFDQRHGLFGAEAQWYLGQFTAYGQVGYDSTVNAASNQESHAWFVRGTGRYFIHPNLMLEGTGMFASGEADLLGADNLGFDTWLWQAKAEYRLAASPLSVFATYQGSRTNYDTVKGLDTKVTDNRVLLGLRLNMGDRNLQATDRAGATLDIISPLANPAR
jgi:hypothetical protein